VASTQRDLIVAQTNLQQQALTLKAFFSKQLTDALGDAQIIATDPLPDPQEADIPPLDEASSTAIRNRPEIPQAEVNVMNNEVAVKATRVFMKPTVDVFGLFATAGLYGNQLLPTPLGPVVLRGGLAQVWNQAINFKSPEYAFGLSLTIPIKNRSALADNARATMLKQQAEIAMQRTDNQVGVEVRSARITLVQDQAQAAASASAVEYSKQSADAEQKKLNAGLSTPYNVILAQRSLLAAQLTEVQARAAYAKAMVEMERSMGVILENSHIDAEQAVAGHVAP
jgi:outer membrane protein TolC